LQHSTTARLVGELCRLGEPSTAAEVGERLELGSHAATVALRRLEGIGLARTVRAPSTNRPALWAATPAGRAWRPLARPDVVPTVRAELGALIGRYCDHGFTSAEVAEAFGLSRQRVSDVRSDPTGAKLKARHERAKRDRCVACGTPRRVDSGRGSSGLCSSCRSLDGAPVERELAPAGRCECGAHLSRYRAELEPGVWESECAPCQGRAGGVSEAGWYSREVDASPVSHASATRRYAYTRRSAA
jgi:hypothetical protein